MLERFREAKQAEIAALRALAEKGRLTPPFSADRPGFCKALCRNAGGMPAIIAEYKRASPSKGTICENLSVEEVARQYCANGAHAISILTEETWFRGQLSFLNAAWQALAPLERKPLLRKDFIFDPLQIEATAATPASALLLIVRLTPGAVELRNLREKAESFGIDCVVEVFDKADLALARESGARIIQVNARDLGTLKVDRGACLELARTSPPDSGELWIAASGMDCRRHLLEAAEAGYAAALVGTALMAHGQPGKALASLVAKG